MNEELQKALAELFNSVISAKDFLVGELPEYVTQLLMWKAVHSGIFFIAGVVCFVFFSKKIGKVKAMINEKQSKYRFEDEIEEGFLYGCFAIGAAIGFLMAAHNLDWLQIAIAPKVWLVEYAAQLIK